MRVPSDLFEQLDKKRWHEKTTFQQVGVQLLEEWLSGERKTPAAVEGEFVKCPVHIRELVNTMIVRLCAMDPAMLPAMEKLLIRFSEPGAIEDVLSAEGRRTLLGPRAVPNKK